MTGEAGMEPGREADSWLTDAIEAAARRLQKLRFPTYEWDGTDKRFQSIFRGQGQAAVEAALPIIRAGLSADVLADQSQPVLGSRERMAWNMAKKAAAHIVAGDLA